jgi:hypothetical protein
MLGTVLVFRLRVLLPGNMVLIHHNWGESSAEMDGGQPAQAQRRERGMYPSRVFSNPIVIPGPRIERGAFTSLGKSESRAAWAFAGDKRAHYRRGHVATSHTAIKHSPPYNKTPSVGDLELKLETKLDLALGVGEG